MHQKGKTIAVLGCGFNRVFPEENKGLAESILKNGGLLISEYSLDEEKRSQNFPKRNRIMSGLSFGVFIIEAKNKSGSLITARYAKEQSKKIFCLPGDINRINSIGTNNLIKNGAKLVTNVNDILDEITNVSETIKDEMCDEYKKVYEVLTNVPININQICKKANLRMGEVNQIITMLEIEGLIKSLPNNEFVKV